MKKTIMLLFLAVVLSTSVFAFRDIDATFLNQDPDPVEPGEYVDLRWRIENSGSEPLTDIKAELEPKYPFIFDSESDRVKTIDRLGMELEGEKAVVLKFRARVDENAVQGDYELDLSYSMGGPERLIEESTISVESRQITLAIAAVETNPERPTPGQKIDMKVHLKNLGSARVENVKVSLGLDGTKFTAVDSSNEKVLTRIAGNQDAIFSFTAISDPDTKSKVHKIPLMVTYQDKFEKTYGLNSSFGIIVESKPDYLMNLEESEVYTVDSKGQVIISFSNIGVSDINFVTTELMPSEDYEIISNPVVYLGNLESDDFETAEYMVYVKKQGEVPLKVKATFKDSFNVNYEEDIIVPLNIYSKQKAVELGLVKQKSAAWIIVLLIIAVVFGYYWVKKRKKKK